MRGMLLAAGLLLALAHGVAAQEFDCVAGFCLDQPVALDAPDAGWQVEDWPDPEVCTQVSGGSLPDGVGMLLRDGRVARFEIGLSGGDDVPSPVAPWQAAQTANLDLPRPARSESCGLPDRLST